MQFAIMQLYKELQLIYQVKNSMKTNQKVNQKLRAMRCCCTNRCSTKLRGSLEPVLS